MNLMQIMALMGQGGGQIARAGPLAPRGPGNMQGGPLSIGAGTMAQQLSQPIERIDPNMGMDPRMDPGAAAAPAMMGPEFSPETYQMAAASPFRGPLADGGMAPAAPDAAPAGRRGVFGRIGDFIGSDEGKGALLRASAALLGGGSVGDGIAAGAQFVDGRKQQRAAAEAQEREFGQRDRNLDIQQQGTDQTGLYQAGQLQNTANKTAADMLEAEQDAMLEAKRLNLDWSKLQQADKQFMITAALRQREEAGRNERHTTVSGSTAYASDSATLRQREDRAAKAQAEGSNLGKIVTSTDAVDPVEAGWFTGPTPGKPATRVETNVRPMPQSKEQLVPGTVYATAQGNARWNGAAFEAIE